ncbi:MAG TPA: HD domain-containing protein [archaeon]|nr:HD domain-containing protein [archaeon]
MPQQKTIIEKIQKTVKQKTKNYGCHGWDHVERVYNLCIFIGRQEKADIEILKIASLLHDIKRDGEKGDHALESSVEAEKLLRKLHFPQNKIMKVTDAIKAHRFRGKIKPLTLEAKILSDADKLDAMGAVGIYRASSFGAESKRSLQQTITHFHEKLLKLRRLMYTPTGKNLANKRNRFMLAYLKQLEAEAVLN